MVGERGHVAANRAPMLIDGIASERRVCLSQEREQPPDAHETLAAVRCKLAVVADPREDARVICFVAA